MAKLNINSTIRMNSGYEIPMLGFGVYQTPANVAEEVSAYAIKSGYRHIDSATAYRNEKPSAAGMLKANIPRDQLFFTSKVPPKCINYTDAKKSARAWKALVEAVEEGKVRSIGVSNYGIHHLEELEQWMGEQEKEGKMAGKLSVNQVELHPWLARDDIVEWCKKRQVVLEAYSPLVRATKIEDPLLVPLAKKHGKTTSQILLRWGLQKGFVILPKSVTLGRIEENAKLYDFELSQDDMKSLQTGLYEPCAWDPTTSKD